MSYTVKPLTLFSRFSDYKPLTKEEYAATTHPRGGDAPAVSDRVDLSTASGRQSIIDTIISRLGGDSQKSLVNTLTPSAAALGGSYGLYAGVGEIPAYKVRSLISMYV